MRQKRAYTIGVDIGGTYTDAVLVDDAVKIKASCKIPTAKQLESGVQASIETLLAEGQVHKDEIQGIYIGTTHATNAILEAKGLFKVGVLRLAGQRPMTLDPCFRWPEIIKSAVFSGARTVSGGFRCDQKAISPLSKKEIQEAVAQLVRLGMESLAIVGVFSPISPAQELEAKAIAHDLLGIDFPVTISADIGGMGFVERESAAILNAALKKPMSCAFRNMEQMKRSLCIHAPLFVTQNDGSIIDLVQAMEKPLLTVSSGPTNSFIGGVKLAGMQESIVVDIGGTSVDIGVVLNGYPRRSLGQAMIGGIPLNFRMPDVLSLPIGGGSVVRRAESGFLFGPDSVGSRIFHESCLFGGQTVTLTDIACKAGLFSIPGGDISRIFWDEGDARKIIANVLMKIQDAIRVMRGSKKELPVISVGGGAQFLNGIADVIPDNSAVANAYGAALAEVSCTVDTVVSLKDREKMLLSISNEAIDGAVRRGAKRESLRIVDVQVIPYHYVPNCMGRVVVVASGRSHS